MMTSSPVFQLLCCELVQDYYGDFYRSIFESLVSGGRLSASQVAQKCHLPLRQARAGLSGLIQLRLVDYYTTKETPTVYSANLVNAYDIVRTGRLIALVHERHGKIASKLVSSACKLGFATVGELRDRFLYDENKSGSQDAAEIDKLLQTLIDDHVLIMRRQAHSYEIHDAKKGIEVGIMSPAALAKLSGTKAKLEHNEAIESRYQRAVDTGHPEDGHVNEQFMSRKMSRSEKAVNGVVTNGCSSAISALLQPNHHKVVTLSQVACAQESATRTHGRKAAAILCGIVQQVANLDFWSKHGAAYVHRIDMYKLQQDTNAALHRQVHVTTINDGNPRVNGNGPETLDKEHNVSIGDIERELLLLVEGSQGFISCLDSSWTVEKDALDAWTCREETLRIMDSRLDPPGPRILRILIDKGKLEEKTLQEIGLLGAKELRQNLSKLKQAGYLDLQEIPRDPHRLPNKTVFLWNYNAERVANLVLETVYASIVRLLQMLKLERKSLAGTLEKIEREDVKGNERKMLAPGEYTVLVRFRRLEEWIWGEINRLDSTVAILKDLR